MPWIFEDTKGGLGPLATNSWKELVTVHALTGIMREKHEADFSRLLNRLREGKQTQEDMDKLKERLIDPLQADYPNTAPHLFVTNVNVDRFNEKVLDRTITEKVMVNSQEAVVGDVQSCVKEQLINSLPEDVSMTAGLSHLVNIGEGLVYGICQNLDVTDGLTNGATCYVKYIERRQQNTMRPSIIWILFSDTNLGKQSRVKYKHVFTKFVS